MTTDMDRANGSRECWLAGLAESLSEGEWVYRSNGGHRVLSMRSKVESSLKNVCSCLVLSEGSARGLAARRCEAALVDGVVAQVLGEEALGILVLTKSWMNVDSAWSVLELRRGGDR